MPPPACQVPEQPALDRARRELAAVHSLPGARHVFEQPCEFRAAEIRVDREARAFLDERVIAFATECFAAIRRSAVLPNDRRRDRLAGAAVPEDDGLPLIRYP